MFRLISDILLIYQSGKPNFSGKEVFNRETPKPVHERKFFFINDRNLKGKHSY